MSSPLLIWWTFAPDATADLARSLLCLPSPCFLLLFLCHIKVASAIPNGPRRPLGACWGRRLLISPFQAPFSPTPFCAVFWRKERNFSSIFASGLCLNLSRDPGCSLFLKLFFLAGKKNPSWNGMEELNSNQNKRNRHRLQIIQTRDKNRRRQQLCLSQQMLLYGIIDCFTRF